MFVFFRRSCTKIRYSSKKFKTTEFDPKAGSFAKNLRKILQSYPYVDSLVLGVFGNANEDSGEVFAPQFEILYQKCRLTTAKSSVMLPQRNRNRYTTYFFIKISSNMVSSANHLQYAKVRANRKEVTSFRIPKLFAKKAVEQNFAPKQKSSISNTEDCWQRSKNQIY